MFVGFDLSKGAVLIHAQIPEHLSDSSAQYSRIGLGGGGTKRNKGFYTSAGGTTGMPVLHFIAFPYGLKVHI